MPLILQPGYENTVRLRLGVKQSELPDLDIQDRLVTDLAEAITINRIPNYNLITDQKDLLFLQNAVINYICYLLSPSMARRVNQEVSTIDVKWKKDKINWEERAEKFLIDFENAVNSITSVEVLTGEDSIIFGIVSSTGESKL